MLSSVRGGAGGGWKLQGRMTSHSCTVVGEHVGQVTCSFGPTATTGTRCGQLSGCSKTLAGKCYTVKSTSSGLLHLGNAYNTHSTASLQVCKALAVRL